MAAVLGVLFQSARGAPGLLTAGRERFPPAKIHSPAPAWTIEIMVKMKLSRDHESDKKLPPCFSPCASAALARAIAPIR